MCLIPHMGRGLLSPLKGPPRSFLGLLESPPVPVVLWIYTLIDITSFSLFTETYSYNSGSYQGASPHTAVILREKVACRSKAFEGVDLLLIRELAFNLLIQEKTG